MIRPTPRAAALFAAGVVLAILLMVVAPHAWPFDFAFLAVALIACGVDYAISPAARRVRIDLQAPGVLYIGETGELVVEMTAGRRLAPGCVAEGHCDVAEVLAQPVRQRTAFDAAGRLRMTFELRPRRRGRAVVERVWLRWHGPLGLIWRGRIMGDVADIPVIPNVRAVRSAAIRFFSRDALFGIKPQRQQGDGSDFEALREYTPGLDPRSIDWKHSARHRNLVCKEFQTERNHQIILAVDTGQFMCEPLEQVMRLDRAINAGLILAYTGLRHGDRVGLFGFDSRVRLHMRPIGGPAGFPAIQKATADLDYHAEETNYTLGLTTLLGRLNRRSLIVLMTEFADTVMAELMVENLERLARHHLVLFVTFQNPELLGAAEAPPGTFKALAEAAVADDFLRERRVVHERLRRLGIHCLDVPWQSIGSELVNRYLFIKRRELI